MCLIVGSGFISSISVVPASCSFSLLNVGVLEVAFSYRFGCISHSSNESSNLCAFSMFTVSPSLLFHIVPFLWAFRLFAHALIFPL